MSTSDRNTISLVALLALQYVLIIQCYIIHLCMCEDYYTHSCIHVLLLQTYSECYIMFFSCSCTIADVSFVSPLSSMSYTYNL